MLNGVKNDGWYALAIAICAPSIATIGDAWQLFDFGQTYPQYSKVNAYPAKSTTRDYEAWSLHETGVRIKEISEMLGIKYSTAATYISKGNKRYGRKSKLTVRLFPPPGPMV